MGAAGSSNTARTQAFLTATSISDQTIAGALNTMDLALIAAGLLPSGTGAGTIKALYPMVGGTATTHKFNFVDPQDTDAAFRLSFQGGWTHSATGAKPNGTNAYADTFFIPSAQITQNSAIIGFYSGTAAINGTVALGCGTGVNYYELYPAYPSYGVFGDVNDKSLTYTANINASGLIFANRNNATQKTHSIRGVKTIQTENSNGIPTDKVVLGARNYQGTISIYSNFEHRLSFMGSGLTNTEMDNFYTLVQAFQTALSRNV